jgi:hypothetical protein
MPKQPRRVDGWLLDRHTLAPLRSHWIKHHGNPALDGLRKGKLHAQSWDEVVDFLVVGSGGGSMCAGLAAKALGKSPYILEKTDRIGGSTAMSGGVLWVPNHPLQAREGVPDSDEAGTHLSERRGRQRWRARINAAAQDGLPALRAENDRVPRILRPDLHPCRRLVGLRRRPPRRLAARPFPRAFSG